MNGTSILKNSGVRAFLGFASLFWLAMAYVFAAVLPVSRVTLSPDNIKHYSVNYAREWWDALLAGSTTATPLNFFYKWVGHPLWWQELEYAGACFFAALGVFLYLRTQRLSRVAAYGGGLLFACSGYSLTLFAAGHMGYFILITYIVFAFGLMVRCFTTRRVMDFILLGAVVAWGEIQQADIWLLFVFLLVAFGVWRSYRAWRDTRSCAFMWRVWPRFLISAVVLAVIDANAIQSALTDTLASRDAQIQESTKMSADSSTSADARWIFVTNWSLPPEDVLEFAVPGIFGNDSMRPPYPYWGRLGQAHPSVFQKGRMMPNYRQHTVYFGLTALLLALAGCVAWLTRHGTKVQEQVDDADFGDVPFWCAVWAVCLVVAMGRYTPVYRLVYHLPFMDYLRAPVKFVHLVELANAMLAGFGLAWLSARGVAQRVRWVMPVICGMVCVVVLIALAVIPMASVQAHIAALGLGTYAAPLAAYMRTNLCHALAVGLMCGGVFAFAAWTRGVAWRGVACAMILIVVNTVDLAGVARRYVEPVDVGPHHAENAVIRTMLKRTGGTPCGVMNYVTSNAGEADWFSMALQLHGFVNAAPSATDPNDPRRAMYVAMEKNPVAYWRANKVRFVLLPRASAMPLVRQGVATIVADFELTREGQVRMISPTQTSCVIAELKDYPAVPASPTRVSHTRRTQVLALVSISVTLACLVVAGISVFGGCGLFRRVCS